MYHAYHTGRLVDAVGAVRHHVAVKPLDAFNLEHTGAHCMCVNELPEFPSAAISAQMSSHLRCGRHATQPLW